MVTMAVLLFDHVLASTAIGIADLLHFASGAFKTNNPGNEGAGIRVRLISRDGNPIKTMNGLTVTPHCSAADMPASDAYLVPAIMGNIDRTLRENEWILRVLASANSENRIICSNSNGLFFLAEAGVLDGKKAVTFWHSEELFRERYPLVDLQSNRAFVKDGNIFSDAGGESWFDLGLNLIELFLDHQTALIAAKYCIVDSERNKRLSFNPLISKRFHPDRSILRIQDWIDKNYMKDVGVEQLGLVFGLSQRTLVRRFRSATGLTPIGYLQDLRINKACELLTRTNHTISEITLLVGYKDTTSFIRLFKKKTSRSPAEYREKYKSGFAAQKGKR